MENKPIVTCHGDQTLFSKLHSLVVRGLMREMVEWKRSYGRPARTVRVESTFVPFNPSILPSDDDWTLLCRPFFHTYWTDCDVDGYKASVKDDIADWLATLKERDIPDWLIVVIVNEDSRVKSRLLRNSVYDKVKNDFCNKLTDRCLVLSEPLKNDAKASESWSSVLSKMRQLLLESYSRNLGRFEEFMRAQREKRTDPKWSYCTYFLLQEELAFMYEMLGLYEDALVQYDELDALFTQFVLNFAVGDNAPWLVNFSKHPATSWDGLCLSQPINISKRQMIKRQEASLLDLRNYLFSRQCTLLFLVARPWEVGERALPFMHNCIKELGILEITLPEGAVDCWVYLSCLEVLSACEKLSHLGHVETYSLCSAGLWDYARTKLRSIAALCDLMPDADHEMTRSRVSRLKRMQGVAKYLVKVALEAGGESEPLNNLKEALSSKEAFHKRYLELSELALCSFKHIGRLRSARKVGKDLASFHMMLNEPEKAESYLNDAVKMFKAEGWEMLADDTRMAIAWCQKATNQMTKYCRTCMYITSSPTLPKETRARFQQELETLGSSSLGTPLLVRCAPVFYISDIQPTANSAGHPSSIKLNLLSNLVEPITVDTICISVIFWTPVVDAGANPDRPAQNASSRRRSQSNTLTHSRQRSGSGQHSREPSGSSIVGIDLYNRIQETIQASAQPLDLHALVEVQVDDPASSSSAVVCRSPLRRMKSIPGVTKEKEVVRDEWDLQLSVKDLVLQPGVNEVCVSSTLNTSGCYLVNQLCIKFKGIEFFKNLTTECLTLSINNSEPILSLDGVHAPLVAGLQQDLRLSVNSTNELLGGSDPLRLTATSGLLLTSECLSVDGTLSLSEEAPECGPVQIIISALAAIPEDGHDSVCHELTLSGGNLKEPITKSLEFILPLRVTHLLHTAYRRKFVQIVLVGCLETSLELSHPLLQSPSVNVSFLSMFANDQTFIVRKDQSVSFVWELQTNDSFNDALVPCTFQLHYQARDVATVPQEQKYSFTLENFATLFLVTSALVPGSDDGQSLSNGLQVGNCYNVRLDVTPAILEASAISYEVTFNEKDWSVTGQITGDVVMENGRFQVSVSACPQRSGYLYLPSIRLLRLTTVPENEKEHGASGEDSNSSSESTSNSHQTIDSEQASVDVGNVSPETATAETPSPDVPQSRQTHRLEPFNQNQIYDCTQRQQIYVCSKDERKRIASPPPTVHATEIIML